MVEEISIYSYAWLPAFGANTFSPPVLIPHGSSVTEAEVVAVYLEAPTNPSYVPLAVIVGDEVLVDPVRNFSEREYCAVLLLKMACDKTCTEA